MRSSKLRWIAAACVVAALSLILAACGGGGSDSSSSQSNTTEEASTTEEGSTTASEESGGGTQTVSFQLDWTPNTNHTGLYVAQEKGLYEKAGINLEILPYSEGSADTLIGAGKADCGISFQENIPIAVAAGSSEKAVLPILQHEANALIVKEDSEFKSPKDLSGKKYGGFGIPYEVPMVNQMIEYDGGSGEVQNVILNTGAYEAVYHGQVDTSLAFRTWELIEAAERGIKLREFPVQDYGVPDTYNVLIACNNGWLEQNHELAKKFIQATAEGYEDASQDPKEAAEILIKANPGAFPNENLVFASAEKLAKEFYLGEEGKFGCWTAKRWEEYPQWAAEKGIISDANGNKVTEPPSGEEMYTDEFLPSWCGES
ncbi:MAG: hypothetical protein BGO11_05225 [Solirubrobacterales bacterium 70-9]|nr:MAG: hypothetical protein BGO11_05225 [Solirubrobacterales bacterium 70-9]